MNTRLEFSAGNEQIFRTSVNPKVTWEFTIEGVVETMNDIQDFFEAHSDGTQFYYIDYRGEQHRVRFEKDAFEPTGNIGWDQDGFGVKGFSVTINLRKVWST